MPNPIDWIRFARIRQDIGSDAYLILLEIIYKDSEYPGQINLSIDTLYNILGISQANILKAIKKLKNKKYISGFIPDNYAEEGIYRINCPLIDEEKIKNLRKDHPELKGEWKYSEILEKNENQDEKKENLSWLIEKMMDLQAGTVNSFFVDEMNFFLKQYEFAEIKKAILIMQKRGWKSSHSLRCILEEKNDIDIVSGKLKKEKRNYGNRSYENQRKY